MCKVTIYAPIFRWLNPGLNRSLAEMFVFGFFGDFLGYWAAVGVLHAVEYHREAREREVQAAALDGALRAGELQMLRAQLQPHFLFNTLQAISTLIHRDPPAADRMLTDLSDLLRTSLTSASAQEVSLADELTFLRRYIDIMCVRFGDRLEVAVDVPDDLLGATVPSLALQPLVENAIRHGMANRVDVGHVVVRARREDGRLVLAVHDDGPGPPAAPVPDGIGLANTRERLRRLYGVEGRLEVGGRSRERDNGDPRHPAPLERPVLTVRILVVDDEALARERVVSLLRESAADVEIVAQCSGGQRQ